MRLSMERREFLGSLATASMASTLLQTNIAQHIGNQISHLKTVQSESGLKFTANDDGILIMEDYESPTLRREIFNLNESDFQSAEAIAKSIGDWPPVSARVALHYDDKNFDAVEKSIEIHRQLLRNEGFTEDQIDSHVLRSFGPQTIADKPDLLTAWVLELNSQNLEVLKRDLYVWLDETPNWSWESEYAFMVGSNEIVTSSFFEKLPPDVLANLGVYFTDVETRRTEYKVAKLMKSTTKANIIAQDLGLQLTFGCAIDPH
jgi:hypothetical protein